jgi:predicted transcriptional regulator
MKKGEWTFLSNHGHVLAYIVKHPKSTNQEIAQNVRLSVSGTQKIITDLEIGGYVDRLKVGRRNEYRVHPELPLRHSLLSGYPVREVLLALGCIFTNT